MGTRNFAYPDHLLFSPFYDVPRLRAEARVVELRALIAVEADARAALAAARSARYGTREDRGIAVDGARLNLQVARLRTQRVTRADAYVGDKLVRSRVVRALVAAASYHPLPDRGLGAAGRGSDRGQGTTVTFHAVTRLLLARCLPGATLEKLVDRSLASPEIVETARQILLLSGEDQEAFAYETLYGFSRPLTNEELLVISASGGGNPRGEAEEEGTS